MPSFKEEKNTGSKYNPENWEGKVFWGKNIGIQDWQRVIILVHSNSCLSPHNHLERQKGNVSTELALRNRTYSTCEQQISVLFIFVKSLNFVWLNTPCGRLDLTFKDRYISTKMNFTHPFIKNRNITLTRLQAVLTWCSFHLNVAVLVGMNSDPTLRVWVEFCGQLDYVAERLVFPGAG